MSVVPPSADALRGVDVFTRLGHPELAELVATGSFRELGVRQRLSSLRTEALASGGAPSGREMPEHYCFVLRGMIAVTLEPNGGGSLASRASAGVGSSVPPSRPHPSGPHSSGAESIDYVAALGPGSCFSDGFLREDPQAAQGTSDVRVDCAAISQTTLLLVERTRLASFMGRHPAWADDLRQRVAHSRSHFLEQQEPARRVVQDFFLRYGYADSKVVRIGQVDRCLECNKCQEACAARHGAPRVIRSGLRLGRLAFPIVCRSCQERACLAACGFGGVSLDEVTGDVRIGDRCRGCGACAQQCPHGAISMVAVPYTSADFPDPIPVNDARGMTNVGNLYVAGDVSGAALIRLSLNEAVRAVDAITPRGQPQDPNLFEVAIIGAGPAGLAAALRCQERKLSYVVLEKDRVASTIRDYPKNKHVMAEPSAVALLSSLWFQDCTKEELLERWQGIARDRQLRIVEDAEVLRVERLPDRFELGTPRGSVQACHVVLCIGKRGSPRKLGLPGESHPRVRYSLADPEEFADQRVLVVGGGDSAVEAALSLADVPGTAVTLSYRRGAFSRTKALNRQRLEAYQRAGRIRVELKSTVDSLEPGWVRLSTEAGSQRVENDVVFALLGADPPTAFLQQSGIQVLEPGSAAMAEYAKSRGQRQQAVKCDQCSGFADRACITACPTGGLLEMAPAELFLEPRRPEPRSSPKFSLAPFIEGLEKAGAPRSRHSLSYWLATRGTLLGLIVLGVETFLRSTLPERSLESAYYGWSGQQAAAVSYSSGRGLGHWLGYLGAALMLACVLYSARTRLGWWSRRGPQSSWLSAHLWVGFAGAALVTMHAAFKMDRWASIALVLMWAVITTGALGRYVYGKVHSGVSLAEFELRALRRRCLALAEPGHSSLPIRVLLGSNRSEALIFSSRPRVFSLLWLEVRDRLLMLWLRAFGLRGVADRRARSRLLRALSAWARARRQGDYWAGAEAVLHHWNLVHIVLTIVMFILAGIHIVYGFMYKAV